MYSFNNIVKEDIIIEHSLQLYEKLLTKKGKFFYVPWRVDNHPSISLFKNYNNQIYWKDLARGTYGNIIELGKMLYGEDYLDALYSLIEEEYKPKIKVSDNPVDIRVTKRDFTEKDIEYFKKYDLVINDISDKVVSIKHLIVNGTLVRTLSDFELGFAYIKDHKIKVYFPNSKQKSKKFMTNSNSNNLNIMQDGKMLHSNIVFITKSVKDALVLRSIGYPAFELDTEAVLPTKEQIDYIYEHVKSLRGQKPYIIVMYDNDEAGKKMSEKGAKNNKDSNIFYTVFPGPQKDPSDYVAANNKLQLNLVLTDLITLLVYYNKENYDFSLQVDEEMYSYIVNNNYPLLLAYGTLRFDQGNAGYREKNGDITRVKSNIRFPGYTMGSLGGFPGVHKDPENELGIVCDMWTINNKSSERSLDNLEGVPYFYRRDYLRVRLVNGDNYFIKDCVVYIYCSELNNIIEHGDWINRYSKKLNN